MSYTKQFMKNRHRKMQTVLELALKIDRDTDHPALIEYNGHVDTFNVTIRESADDYETILFKSYQDMNISRNAQLFNRVEAEKQNILNQLDTLAQRLDAFYKRATNQTQKSA